MNAPPRRKDAPAALTRSRALDDLRLVLDRARTCHNIEVAGADLAARDLDDRVLGVEFAVDSLERLSHALYTLDHVIRHNVTFVQTGRVAHQAEDKWYPRPRNS